MILIPSQRINHLIRDAVFIFVLGNAPIVADAANLTTVPSRSLPAAGTTWCYSAGLPQATSMTLKGVTSGIASYDVGDPEPSTRMDEKVDAYTLVNATRHGERRLLVFPLAKGKSWSDEFTEKLTPRVGQDAQWQYTYHAIAQSRVVGTEKRQVGAGTFDTFVIERNTAWTKSAPHSSSATLRDLHCDDADCSVTGYSKEVFWYAPSIGRAVLRAYSQSGDSDFIWNRSPEELLKDASSLVTELVDYGSNVTCKDIHPPVFARVPSAPWYGFPLFMNNTWEFLMQRDIARE
jgi:hypothetical protein